uniref:Uncharacterized protein n=1 Tax=Arundo donax TaxID=35708 RepID=A0A0A9FV81_ARUDO
MVVHPREEGSATGSFQRFRVILEASVLSPARFSLAESCCGGISSLPLFSLFSLAESCG